MYGHYGWSLGAGDRFAFQSRLSPSCICEWRWLCIRVACSARHGRNHAGSSSPASDACWQVSSFFFSRSQTVDLNCCHVASAKIIASLPNVLYYRKPLQVNGGGIDVRLGNETFGSPSSDFLDPNSNPTPQSIDYRFSVGQLPLWAKKQINTASVDDNAALGSNVRSLGVDLPKGRWAQRVQQGDGITVKSVYDSDEVIPFPLSRNAIDSDGGGGGGGGSKDSSIDSGTETKYSSDYRRETVNNKKVGRKRFLGVLCNE